MARRYRAFFQVTTLTGAPIALCSVAGIAGRYAEITRWQVSSDQVALPTAEMVPTVASLLSGAIAGGTGGAVVTPSKDPGDPVPQCGARQGDTAPFTGAVTNAQDSFGLYSYAGKDTIPTEPVPMVGAEVFQLVAAATTAAIRLTGFIEWVEKGG